MFYIESRFYVFNVSELKIKIMKDVHETLFDEHVKRLFIYNKINKYYYWSRMTDTVSRYVKNYYICKRFKIYKENKYEFLNFLSISEKYWQNIFIDFITFLFIYFRFNRKFEHIIIVVNKLFKKKICNIEFFKYRRRNINLY